MIKPLSYKAVLFDLDGTLIDTAPDFVRIIHRLCQRYNKPMPSNQAIREQVSSGAKAMVGLFGNTLDEEQLSAYHRAFLDDYEQDICVESALFKGLDGLLDRLDNQGIVWGIVTNKPRHLSQKLLDKLQLSQRCAVLVCPDDVKHAKPSPEPLLLAVKQLNNKLNNNKLNNNKFSVIESKDCIYVGDHSRDIDAGKAAGMTTVIAKYGYIAPEDSDLTLWGADYVIESADELVQLLQLVV